MYINLSPLLVGIILITLSLFMKLTYDKLTTKDVTISNIKVNTEQNNTIFLTVHIIM